MALNAWQQAKPAKHPRWGDENANVSLHHARRPARRGQEIRDRGGDHRRHNAVTGAASFFAQVIFTEVAKGNHFMGGAPLASDQIFVHGFIRAGRSLPDR
jgi:hypothetical protein